MRTMSLEEILDRIEHARRFGKSPGVEVTAQVLKQLGNPERELPYIHVAGTNGKGSCCAFLESMAMEAGYRVGKFTSPHLIRFHERITVNQEQIPDEAVIRIGEMLLHREFGVELTMFDYCLVMAILYFREQKCNLVILETGLGGRLDSTSALSHDPLVNVITRIGYDHMAILGDTLAEIAGEKAGIIRANVPVVVGLQEQEAMAVLRREAEIMHAPFYEVTDDAVAQLHELQLHMLGEYQYENAATAMLAMEVVDRIQKREYDKKHAIAHAFWPGRMEVLREEPFLMVDGAHNANGVEALKKSLQSLYPNEKFHFVMGVMADKNYHEMIMRLLPLAEDFVTVTPESERALQGTELANLIAASGVPAHFEEDWKSCLQKDFGGRTICFGSLYFIGAVKEWFEEVNCVLYEP